MGMGTTVVVTDKPENILQRIRFYEIDSRLIEKKLTPKEKKIYWVFRGIFNYG
jgi:shikimate kinase